MLACSIQQHIREKHTSEVFVCPLKGCEFEGKRQSYVRHHWNREHSNLEFPQIRKKSKFTFEIRTSRNIKQEVSLIILFWISSMGYAFKILVNMQINKKKLYLNRPKLQIL